MKKNLKIILFFVICAAQLGLFSFLIINTRIVKNKGSIIRLKCQMYDPYDFMKGRYLDLNFAEQNIDKEKLKKFPGIDNIPLKTLEYNDTIYCILEEKGKYNVITDLTLEKPGKDLVFIKSFFSNYNSATLNLEFPFNKYYMQEEFANKANKIFNWEFVNDPSNDIIMILAVDNNGNTVQKGLEINNEPIEKYIERLLKEDKAD